jgi:hypothetical protein
VYSGSSLLAHLNFQSVSRLYKNFTRMSPTEFESLIHLMGKRISKKDTTFRKAISVQERLALTLRVLASGDSYVSLYHSYLSPLHSEHTATKAAVKELTRRTVVYCVRNTKRVHTCSGRNCNIPLMRRANTDIAPNKNVTLHRNQLLNVTRSRPHCHVTALRSAVTLQVCTRLKAWVCGRLLAVIAGSNPARGMGTLLC